MNKRAVSQNINACSDIIKANAGAKAAEIGKKIAILRVVLLGGALLIMLILVGTFVALYKQMIHPLIGFVQLITANQPLNEEKGLQEVRMVASAYNSLRKTALNSTCWMRERADIPLPFSCLTSTS